MYGFLFTVLLPHHLRCIDVFDIRRMTPQAVASMLQPGDLLISHPAHWAVLAQHAGLFPAGVEGVTSTAPCPDALAQSLKKMGLARLTQVYGSSATAGIGTRTAAAGAFRLMPFWTRDAGGAPDDQRLWRRTADGSTASHRIPDRLEWLDEDRFRIVGRLDEAVQVGGTNVYPARVRQVLLDHPQVTEAQVRLMTADEGSRLKAYVVPSADVDPVALQAELWHWTASRLTAPERPKAFTVGELLPRNAIGKLSDWPLGLAQPAPP